MFLVSQSDISGILKSYHDSCLEHLQDTVILQTLFYMIKMNSFWGSLINVLTKAKTERKRDLRLHCCFFSIIKYIFSGIIGSYEYIVSSDKNKYFSG